MRETPTPQRYTTPQKPASEMQALEKRLTITGRALAGADNGLEISLQGSRQPPPLKYGGKTFIPPPDLSESSQPLRGTVDRLGLVSRYHDPALFRRFQPGDHQQQTIYEALETARIELCGGRYMRGVALNMQQAWAEQCAAQGYGYLSPDAPPPLDALLRAIMMRDAGDLPVPESLQPLLQRWEPRLQEVVGERLKDMAASREDQRRFADELRGLLRDLSGLDGHGEPSGEQGEAAQEEGASAASDDTGQTDEEAQAASESGETMQAEQDAQKDAAGEPQDQPGERAIEAGIGQYEEAAVGSLSQDAYGGTEMAKTGDAVATEPRTQPYLAFTTAYDQIITADQLASDQELSRLRGELDQKMDQVQDRFTRLSSQLQRLLLAQQQRRWHFNEEEGVLDSARLARLVSNPGQRRIFKQEEEMEFRDTVVTLLLDNSGSMRGRPITITALSADILARILERAGVKVEILGFTTREWKGGRCFKDWVQAGRPPQPGRLNELCHIIYKSADMPYIRARRNLGLLLKEGMLKENIDGEALLWAHQRLQRRNEARHILMVISDGAPVDDATLSANHPGYLDRHLREVITMIESHPVTELLAIGIGHDVTRYYQRSITIKDVSRLGETMANELVALFSSS